VSAITLFALGGVSQIESEASDAKSEFWIAISGWSTYESGNRSRSIRSCTCECVGARYGTENCSDLRAGLARLHQPNSGRF